jgi:hypothetical protein
MYKLLLIISTLLLNGCAQNSMQSSTKTDSRCSQKHSSGMCRGFFTKYYFDQESKECKKFVWGGCGGSVPFETLKECQKSCQ